MVPCATAQTDSLPAFAGQPISINFKKFQQVHFASPSEVIVIALWVKGADGGSGGVSPPRHREGGIADSTSKTNSMTKIVDLSDSWGHDLGSEVRCVWTRKSAVYGLRSPPFMRGTVVFPGLYHHTRPARFFLHEIDELAYEQSSIALELIGPLAVTLPRPKCRKVGNDFLSGEA